MQYINASAYGHFQFLFQCTRLVLQTWAMSPASSGDRGCRSISRWARANTVDRERRMPLCTGELKDMSITLDSVLQSSAKARPEIVSYTVLCTGGRSSGAPQQRTFTNDATASAGLRRCHRRGPGVPCVVHRNSDSDDCACTVSPAPTQCTRHRDHGHHE